MRQSYTTMPHCGNRCGFPAIGITRLSLSGGVYWRRSAKKEKKYKYIK